jgi:hypothetical protein
MHLITSRRDGAEREAQPFSPVLQHLVVVTCTVSVPENWIQHASSSLLQMIMVLHLLLCVRLLDE